MIVSIAIVSVNGYALANWKFKGSEIFFAVLGCSGVHSVSGHALHPLVIITRELGIFGTLTGVVFYIHTIFGMPILTLLFRNCFSWSAAGIVQGGACGRCRLLANFFQIMLLMSLATS